MEYVGIACLALLALLLVQANIYACFMLRRQHRRDREEWRTRQYEALESVQDIIAARAESDR